MLQACLGLNTLNNALENRYDNTQAWDLSLIQKPEDGHIE